MTEAEWLTCEWSGPLVELCLDHTSERKLRLLAVACCDRGRPHLEPSYYPLADAALAFADGVVSLDEMQAIRARYYRSNDYPDRAAFYDTAASDIRGVIVDVVGELAYQTAIRSSGVQPSDSWAEFQVAELQEERFTIALIRDIFGNPFRPVIFSSEWRTSRVLALAQQMYESRDFSAMPILADALQDAGCDNDDILNHCRDEKQVHVRGCWVVDLVLGKE